MAVGVRAELRVTLIARTECPGRELEHDRRHLGPQVEVLVAVEMGQHEPGRSHRLDLCPELPAQVVGVDPTTHRTAQELLPREREVATIVDQGRDLGGREEGRVLPDAAQVAADAEAAVAQRRGPLGERRGHRQRRGRGDDPVPVAVEDASTHPGCEPEVIRVDDEESGTRCDQWISLRCPMARISGSSLHISRRIVAMTAREDRVETPRLRGK